MQIRARLLGKAPARKKKPASELGQVTGSPADAAEEEVPTADQTLTLRHQFALRRSSRLSTHRTRATAAVKIGTLLPLISCKLHL